MIEGLLAIGFVLAVLYGVAIAQTIALHRLLKSFAWILFACGFIAAGGRAFWGFIRLPAVIIRTAAIAPNITLESLMTAEQWALITTAFVAIGCFIAALDRLRRDLRSAGLK